MRWVAFRTASATVSAVAILLLLATTAGLARMMPWIVAPGVTPELLWPFCSVVLGRSCEVALLLGPPLGFALSATSLVRSGEARALGALGVSPWGLVRAGIPGAAWAGVALAALAMWLGRDPLRPEDQLQLLLDRGREHCAAMTTPGVILVPLVGVQWLCSQGVPPRAVRAIGSPRGGWGTASTLAVGPQVASVELTDAILAFPAANAGGLGIQLSAARIRLEGLPPWGRPRTLPLGLRILVLTTASLSSAAFGAWLILRSRGSGWLRATVVAAAPALLGLGLLEVLDGRAREPLVYLLVPPFVVGITVVAARLVEVAERAIAGRHRR